jgi:hypothetical protein
MKIQTRPYQTGDDETLNSLYKKVFHQEVPDQYWKWKYLDNPLGWNFCHCAIFEDRIVGFAGGIPYRIKWGENDIIAGQITDAIIEPALMGKKVYSHIQKANMADIKKKADAVYGFTNAYSYTAYHIYDYAFRVPRMVKILNADAIAKNLMSSALAAKVAGTIGNLGFGMVERMRKKTVKSPLKVKSISSFDPSIDTFIQTIASDFKMMYIRDHKYLNWRYCNNPIHKYDIYIVEDCGKITGFVVLRNQPGKTHQGFILEFFADKNREDVQDLLLKETTRHFRQRGTDAITCWVFPHSPYYRAFRHHLYVKKKGNLIVLITVSKENDVLKNDFKDERNWHISCGDQETF